eukprot:GFYU01000277.1.p1 GENE.GFYU01000277.1~~GFYU01000277.1.p1  ORF type:complete len:417 (+),score=66.49 GFYU01000277.1:222-1472(+)
MALLMPTFQNTQESEQYTIGAFSPRCNQPVLSGSFGSHQMVRSRSTTPRMSHSSGSGRSPRHQHQLPPRRHRDKIGEQLGHRYGELTPRGSSSGDLQVPASRYQRSGPYTAPAILTRGGGSKSAVSLSLPLGNLHARAQVQVEPSTPIQQASTGLETLVNQRAQNLRPTGHVAIDVACDDVAHAVRESGAPGNDEAQRDRDHVNVHKRMKQPHVQSSLPSNSTTFHNRPAPTYTTTSATGAKTPPPPSLPADATAKANKQRAVTPPPPGPPPQRAPPVPTPSQMHETVAPTPKEQVKQHTQQQMKRQRESKETILHIRVQLSNARRVYPYSEEVKFTPVSGFYSDFFITPADMVSELYVQIEQSTKIPTGKYDLYYVGKLMKPHQTLRECNVKDTSRIHMVLRTATSPTGRSFGTR